MPLEAPPSRYRVIERGGRLVVIDTVIGGTPLKARDLLPNRLVEDAATPVYSGEGDDPIPPVPLPPTLDLRLRGNVDAATGMTPRAPSPPRASLMPSPIATPPGLLTNVASTVCGDRRDADGRLQWNTARWFDAKGPRTVALSTNAAQQLGFVTLASLVSAVVAIVVAVTMGFVGVVILFVAVSLLRQGKPIITGWIDRLAAP